MVKKTSRCIYRVSYDLVLGEDKHVVRDSTPVMRVILVAEDFSDAYKQGLEKRRTLRRNMTQREMAIRSIVFLHELT
jgi:hypothetical protein